ncbi:MAG: hypothetical protein EBU92_04275 [Betaproteobacteria bacterium]|nr:hypothetical protein [Betaproteobacteria bacterium]
MMNIQSELENTKPTRVESASRLIIRSLPLLLSVLSACAPLKDIHACNQLAYSQAPPVYDNRHFFGNNRCFGGVQAGTGKSPGVVGLPSNPFLCDMFMEDNDANVFARRAIFDACMKGEAATNLPPISPPTH